MAVTLEHDEDKPGADHSVVSTVSRRRIHRDVLPGMIAGKIGFYDNAVVQT